jgi:hypothetical protein
MSRATRPRFASGVLLLTAIAVLISQAGGHAALGDALPFAKAFSGTIDYVVGSVDLTEQANPIDEHGFSTGTMEISGIPSDADIVAAYLYWETITLDSDPGQAAGVKFRDHEILLNDLVAVKRSSQPLEGSTASCWSSGVPLRMTLFRADVLPFLPVREDAEGRPTGKRIVNSADLTRHGLTPHTVYLPVSAGNQVPESAGATLVVVFNKLSGPLRKVVMYDGIFIQPNTTTPMIQSLQGFYKSASVADAKITHILAAGQPNGNERIFFNDANGPNMSQISAPDPIMGGNAAQRGWTTFTQNVSQYMHPGANSGDYGETATTKLDHSPGGAYDCLTWGAVIFSTSMADAETSPGTSITGDGIPDGLEEADRGNAFPITDRGLKDPDGTQLPYFKGMGATSSQRDLFIEINGMWAPKGTSYGGVEDTHGHVHLLTPEDLKRVRDGYAAQGVTAHFDVGDVNRYHNGPLTTDPAWIQTGPTATVSYPVVTHQDWVDDYGSDIADAYLVPSALARGGEVIREEPCDASSPSCHFAGYPGTVGWKFGLQLLRDSPVANDGQQLDLSNTTVANEWETGQSSTHRRRFDRARFGLFHYLLYAHARGTPRSQPCLSFGDPAPYPDNGTSCAPGTDNPAFDPAQYHVPTTASGVADLPGGNALVTLGFWDEYVGRPFVRASTTFHELGHNLNLWHGGRPAIWGDDAPPAPTAPSATYIEPNCKPNYQSSMSYLFQVHGLFDNTDNVHLDYSLAPMNALDETGTLSDGSLTPAPVYRSAWYAPFDSALATQLGVPKATRYCSGRSFGGTNPNMARVYTTTVAGSIDWNGDKNTGNSALPLQDVNLDGGSDPMLGFADWSSIRLNQIAAGRKVVKFQAELADGTGYGDVTDFGSGDVTDFGSGDVTDFGSGDITDFGSGDITDFGSGDVTDFGSGVFLNLSSGDVTDFGSGDVTDFGSGDVTDFGSGDVTDFGSGDVTDFGSGDERQEVDYDEARGLGRTAPYGLAACAIGSIKPDGTACNITPQVLPNTPFYHRNLITWNAAAVGKVTAYLIQRKKAADPDSSYAQVGTSTTNYFIDAEELPDSHVVTAPQFTYRVRARFDDVVAAQLSAWSQSATLGAVNDRPQAAADSYAVLNNTTLTVPAPGVLANDGDSDSPLSYIGRRVIITSPTGGTMNGDFLTVTTAKGGTLVMNTKTGGFTYSPKGGFIGSDSFKYKTNDGPWSDPAVPLSLDSDEVIVSITVTKK